MFAEHKLRDYQLFGAYWLAGKTHALLGDVPRIGKTAQAITACDLVEARSILVACPPVARDVWRKEFAKWGRLKRSVHVIEPTRMHSVPEADVLICSYNLHTRKHAASAMTRQKWDVIILDESHYLNVRTAQRSQFVWNTLVHKGKRVWALTGSPLRKDASDLWCVLRSFGYYKGTYWDYVDEFLLQKETPFGREIVGFNGKKLAQWKTMAEKLMLRRELPDVLHDLPNISFTEVEVEPGEVNLRLFFPDIMLKRKTTEDVTVEIATELRAMESWLDLSGRTQATVDGLKGLQSNRTQMSRRFVGLQKVGPVAEMLSYELEQDYYKKVVIFAWHRDVVTAIAKELRQYSPETLYGGQLVAFRDRAISNFQMKDEHRVVVCNIAAAGIAIDLSAATEVVVVEPSYIPEDNVQAIMRVYKYGQVQPISVRFFSIAGSVDQRINSILRRRTRDLVALLATGKPEPTTIDPFA